MTSSVDDPKSEDLSSCATSMTGSCLCGNIKITISDSELFTRRRGHICYCVNCRQSSGSFGASNLLIEDAKVKIEDANGIMKEFIDTKTGSGRPVSRFFCSDYGR